MPLKAYRNEHAKVMLFFVIYKPRGTYFFFFEKKVHFVCVKGRIDLSLHAFWQQRPGLEDGRSRYIYKEVYRNLYRWTMHKKCAMQP